MTIDDLIRTGEGPTLEFKERFPPPQALAKEISAFSNTAGGKIIIGIKEPDIIAGIDPKKFEALYQQAIQRTTGPKQTSSETIEVGGKFIGIVHIEKSTSPVGSSDGYFARTGSSTRSLMPGELKQLFSDNIGVNGAVESLSQTVSKQTEEIGKLRKSFDKANSWKRKFFYALLGALATGISKIVFASLGVVAG